MFRTNSNGIKDKNPKIPNARPTSFTSNPDSIKKVMPRPTDKNRLASLLSLVELNSKQRMIKPGTKVM
jgi:hypothetical protein